MRKIITTCIALLLVLITLVAWSPTVIAEEYECPACGTAVLYGQEECDVCGEVLEWDDIEASIDIKPDTLNLNSKGKWITCYIELEGTDPSTIDITTVKASEIRNYTVDIPAVIRPLEVGDEDGDGIQHVMVKFDRSEFQDAITTTGHVTVTIEGYVTLVGNFRFEGSDTIFIKKTK